MRPPPRKFHRGLTFAPGVLYSDQMPIESSHAEHPLLRIPTLLGAALGLWLDSHYPGKHSWTLALLVAGMVLGCLNAWNWVSKEDEAMRKEQEDDNE